MDRRILAVAVVLLLLGALVWALARPGVWQGGPLASVSIAPDQLTGGTINIIEVTGGAGALLTLPPGVFPVENGDVRANVANLTLRLTEDQVALTVLVPPVDGNMTFVVEYAGGRREIVVPVQPGSAMITSGERYHQNIDWYTSTFQHRVTGGPSVALAAQALEGKLRNLGYQAEIKYYPWRDSGVPGPLPLPLVYIQNVIGMKPGTGNPDEWIVIGGHFDAGPRTTEGAYDNAAGTAAVLTLAETFSTIETNRTIVFAFWGGEEEGLWGSQKWLQQDVPKGITIKANINLDMPGINWPAPFQLEEYIGPNKDDSVAEVPRTIALAENITFNILQYPREWFKIHEWHETRSDAYGFVERGIPSLGLIGEFTNYTQYHTKDDTLATMEQFAGGPDALKGGFNTVVWVSLYAALIFDDDDVIGVGAG